MSTSLALVLLQAGPTIVGPPAERLTVLDLFADAALIPKAIMIALIGLSVAAIVIAVRKVASGPRLAGGSAFVSSLRLGAPLLGLLGGAYGFMNAFTAIASVDFPVTMKIAAPGIAECVFVMFLGLLAGVIAVVCHWAIEARIDRTVLRG